MARMDGDTGMRLPSGKELYPIRGPLSVDDEGKLYEGYDCGYELDWDYTKEDKQFIADYIIKKTKEWLSR